MNWNRTAAYTQRWSWLAFPIAALLWASWLAVSLFGSDGFDLLDGLIGADHLAFYTPARFIREGRAGDFYRYDVVAEYQSSLFPPNRWEGLEAFRNPPFYALLYLPTAGLSYLTSVWIWYAATIACFLVGLRWLGAKPYWRIAAWSATFMPVYNVFSYGQNSLLSFAVLTATFRLLTYDLRLVAGLVAGLLWFKPPLLIGLLVWWLLDWRRYWPCGLGVIVTGTVLTRGSFEIIPEAWTGFVESLRTNVQLDGFGQWKMHNPRAFWRLLLPGEALATFRIVLTLACSAVGVWLFVRLWRHRRNDLPILFGAAVALTLWISPHSMIYEWSLILIPAVLWWQHAPQLRTVWRVLFAAIWLSLFAATDVNQAVMWLEREYLGNPASTVWTIQFSVPVIGWAGWQAVRFLTAIESISPG